MDTCMYLAEKKELRNQMFQFQIENEKSLQILTNQLQHKLSAMDDKLQENTKANVTIEHEKLEQKYRELELNFTLLQENNRLLQRSYVHQKDELALLKNTTMEFRKELSELKQMKSVQQALDLHAVQSKIQSLEQKSNSLTINQNARSQDFLALYNMTRVMENKVDLMGNRVQDIETNQNTTFAAVVSNISLIEGKVSSNSKRVAVTACVGSTQTFSDRVVKFTTVRTEIGINNIATFKSSGKFVCEIPGLYFISARLRTNNGDRTFYVMKNSDYIGYSIADTDGFLLEPDHTSNPGVNNQCISMDACMYLAEKKDLRDQIFQFKLENDKSLRILTNQLQHKLSEMDEKLKGHYKPNDTIEFANLVQKYQLLQGSYIHQKDELEILKNATMKVLQELSELKQLKIAVTACVGSSQKFSDAVVRFSTVRSEIGINNIATFKSSGKFVCEIPGLYYISAHIRTNSGDYGFHVRKNNDYIAYSITDAGLSDSTNPISAVVELQVKDTLYVETSATIYSTYSCVSIVKV
ncbi:COL8A [Mytilus edulis]|uniref:COL8A n=1 Tax=Mytilus edulis TaxID=6550 RepID=A0A8S3UHV5_MYTED|nr:COL8A [Mytilus edulis]